MWHSRFGHASNDMLRKMKNDNSVYGLENFSSIENREPCQPCALKKSTIENIPKASRDISKDKFDLIQSDICGPFPKSLKNQRYMVSFIDDHTEFARLYFMREKSEHPEKFKEYLAHVGKGNVQSLRSDNGTEYTSKAFREICINEGIRQEFTSPYSPFQNGVAERYWRTTCDMTRCFLSESNMKDNFWVRAADTACFIRNRCLAKGNNSDKTPYEMFFDKKPTVYHLRRSGCLACTKTMSNRRKLDPKAAKMIFCGYDWERKSYILYSMKNQFICSRIVKFDEQQFYYSVSKDSSRSFAFQPVVNNQNTEIPTVNSQDGTNDPGIVPTTANLDELTDTESTQFLL